MTLVSIGHRSLRRLEVSANFHSHDCGAIILNPFNVSPPNTAPERFKDRKFYQHNPAVTLMSTTVEENPKPVEEISRKTATVTRPTCIMLPLKGVSTIDQTGKAFDDPAARQALFDRIRATHGPAELIELDKHTSLFARDAGPFPVDRESLPPDPRT